MSSPTAGDPLKPLLASVEKHPGVVGSIIYESSTGNLLYTSLPDRDVAIRYSAAARTLCQVADQGLNIITEHDAARVIRIRSAEHEIVIKPESLYTLVVLQDPAVAQKA